MPDRNSTPKPTAGKPVKPAKPNPAFPLTAHPSGYWCKKIRGKLHYFGKWADPDAALAEYNRVKEALHAGREPAPDPNAVTVKDVCNDFFHAKKTLADDGELAPQTLRDYKRTCETLLSVFGKNRLADSLTSNDFAKLRERWARQLGPYRVLNEVQRTRCIFKFAYEAGLLDKPMRFGPSFKRPSKKTLRLHKANSDKKLFSREEVRAMIDAAGVPLRAMILLGINCGFGNSDVSNLPLSAVDLETGWIDFPRPKTGIARRCWLWPETVQAIREALDKRPEPKDAADAGLVFITKYGDGWGKDIADSPVTKELRKLLNRLGIKGRRNFYALRHTFRTRADAAKDQPAADYIMGHEVAHMSSVYRETIDDDRLQAVAEHVRRWLFSEPTNVATQAGGG